MTYPPSSLNESRTGWLPKSDCPSHRHSEVQVKWWVKLDLSHLLEEKDEFQRMQLYPRAGAGTAHVLHTVWPGSEHTPEPVQLQRPMSPCQTPALHHCCLWPCVQDRMFSELLLPLPCWLWARALTWLFAAGTLTADRPRALSTRLCGRALRHLGSTHVPNHAAVCTDMHLCACCMNSAPFP